MDLLIIIFLLGVVCLMIGTGLWFYFRRQRHRGNLFRLIRSSEPSGHLSSYQHFRLTDQFHRDAAQRIGEDYGNKSWRPGDRLFRLTGRYAKLQMSSERGVLYEYETIGDIEVLIPASARNHLITGDNTADIVVAGSIGYVVRLNGTFDLLEEAEENTISQNLTTTCETSASPVGGDVRKASGDTPENSVLKPGLIDPAILPVNHRRYLKDIRNDQMLVCESDVGNRHVTGIPIVFLWIFCGIVLLPAALFLLMGLLFGGPVQAVELVVDLFLYAMPVIAGGAGLFVFSQLCWLASRLISPNETLLFFDRQNREIIFLSCGHQQVDCVPWENVYAQVEKSRWQTEYGFFDEVTFLELATADRHHRDRVMVRLRHGDIDQALETWRAIQAFMEENLDDLARLPVIKMSRAEPPYDGIYTARDDWSALQNRPDGWYKTLRKLLFIILGGPLPYQLAGWLARRRNKDTWDTFDRALKRSPEKRTSYGHGARTEMENGYDH